MLAHPDPERLAAYGLGRLDDLEADSIHAHLETCAACRSAVEALPDDALAALVRSAAVSSSRRGAPDSGAVPLPDTDPDAEAAAVPAELADHPRYRVVGLLGRGGMGVVYKAEHLLMARTVALKVISRRLTSRADMAERFRREVRVAARLAHPNIVTAYDADQAGDLHFLVMEFVEGVSLARLVEERGPLPVAEACEYAARRRWHSSTPTSRA
jgi:serine/threonine-protein kinase